LDETKLFRKSGGVLFVCGNLTAIYFGQMFQSGGGVLLFLCLERSKSKINRQKAALNFAYGLTKRATIFRWRWNCEQLETFRTTRF